MVFGPYLARRAWTSEEVRPRSRSVASEARVSSIVSAMPLH